MKTAPKSRSKIQARRHKTVGLIGLGIMGSAMAANLMRARFTVTGYDVVAAKRRALGRAGGRSAAGVADVAGAAEIVIASLPSAQSLLDVAAQIAGAANPPTYVIETSTLPIAVKEEARRRLARVGTTLLDCPISGTGAQARTGDVVVFASGPQRACRASAPVLNGFSRGHYYVGPFGAGSKTKFVANLLVAIHNVAAAEALVLAMKAGLDPALTLKVVAEGAGSSRILQLRGPMMVRGRYREVTATLSMFIKDQTIIGDFARELASPTPLLAATVPVYTAAAAMGHGEDDTAAVCAVLEFMAGHRRKGGVHAAARTARAVD
jgi:3-hydroxyisobutyrate dehydrogenase-like beta-hydroxyacid dehydrogenase